MLSESVIKTMTCVEADALFKDGAETARITFEAFTEMWLDEQQAGEAVEGSQRALPAWWVRSEANQMQCNCDDLDGDGWRAATLLQERAGWLHDTYGPDVFVIFRRELLDFEHKTGEVPKRGQW